MAKTPDDGAYLSLISTVDRPLDPHGNQLRRKLLAQVEADVDGCWIWTGVTRLGGKRYPKPYPLMYYHGREKPVGIVILLEWAPEQAAQLQHGMTYRVCGKTLCVRPACMTRKQRSGRADRPAAPLAEIYRLRMVERLPMTEVARRTGLPYRNVAALCYRRDWVHDRKCRPDYAVMAELVASGMSAVQVAEKIGCNVSTVFHWKRAQKNADPHRD